VRLSNLEGDKFMRHSLLKAAAIAGLFFGTVAGAEATPVTSFTPIAPVSGSTSTGALAINDSGIVAGGWYDSNNIEHAFFGPPDGSDYTTFDDGTPGFQGAGTEARAINNGGDITGYFSSSALSCNIDLCEFERAATGKINTIAMSGTPLIGIPGGINTSGQFVGAYYNPADDYQSFGYYGDKHAYESDITLPFSTSSTKGRGLSDSGEVVGFFTSADGTTTSGFVIQDDTVTVVNDPDVKAVNGTFLEGVNKKGWIVGSWDDKAYKPHAFILSPDLTTFIEIKVPDSSYSQSFGINKSDRMVIGGATGPFIYCDSRTNPVPACTPTTDHLPAVNAPIAVPRGTFAQYKCRGDCITYKLATPGAPAAHAGVPQELRALRTLLPGTALP